VAATPAPVARPWESRWVILGGIALTYVAVGLAIVGLYSVISGLLSVIL
jgi:hypothetical protein